MEDRHHGRHGEHGRERREIAEGQGIDEPDVARRHGELDERQALRVVVQAIALRVERDLARRSKALGDLGEVAVGLDPA